MPADLRGEVERAVAAVKDAMASEDIGRIARRPNEAAAVGVAEGAAQAQQSGPSETGKPDVVDAEFEEVDDRDRKAG